MKRFTAVLILISLVALFSNVWAQNARTYNLALNGVEVSKGERGTLVLTGKANGSLSGSFEVSVRYNPVTKAVSGGTWKLTVARQSNSSEAQGALYGTIAGGTVKFNRRGRVEAVEGMQVRLERGAGEYSGTTAGSGEIEGTLNVRRQHPFVGKLRLTL